MTTAGGRDAEAVLEALAPALGRLGTWRHLWHPESSLAHAVARAADDGLRPVHLAIGPVNDCYLTPAVPTALVPLWNYPDVPAVDLNYNGRTNWARIASRADLILAPSRFTAEAFLRAGVLTPTVVLPIPARDGRAGLPTWTPGHPVTLVVPHVAWGGRDVEAEGSKDRDVRIAEIPPPPSSWSDRLKRAGKRRLRRLKPYFSNATVQRLDGYKQRLSPLFGRPDPIRILGRTARLGYRLAIRRWIGEGAHARLRGLGDRLRKRPPAQVIHQPHPRLAPTPLTLSGLVFSADVDYADPTTGDVDVITAALHAFRDRPDVTLLIRLATTPDRETSDLGRIAHACHAPRIDHRCRIAVVAGPTSGAEACALAGASTFHVDSSRSRGWSLPLIEALASGRPAIAPAHSMLGEWVDATVGLAVASHPEPTSWPIDPIARHATSWNRPVWSELRDRLAEAASIADRDPKRYAALASAARRRVAERAGVESVAALLSTALDQFPSRPIGAFSWST